jgi:putative oxidoreductase
MIELLHYGIDVPDVALTINRVLLGVFFAISGYHKLFNPHRHAALVSTFKNLGIPAIRFNQWWVPGVEFMGGLSLVSGILAPLAAMGLMIICFVATCTAGRKRIPEFNPIDKADVVDDYLYLPEVLYMVGLIIIIMAGPGWTVV